MSSAPGVNTALLNFCAQLQDGRNRPTNGQSPSGLALSGAPEAGERQTSTSAAACASTSATVPSTSAENPPRPATDYEWLRSALASVEAPEKRVKQLLFHVENRTADGTPGSLTQEDQLEALAELADMVEDVNWAAEFSLMEGPQRLLQVLHRESAAHPLLPTSGGDANPRLGAPEGTDAGNKEVPPTSTTDACVSSAAVPIFTQLAMVIAHSAQLNEPVQRAYESAHWQSIVLPLLGDSIKAIETLLHLGDDHHALAAQCGESAEVASVTEQATLLMRLLAALLHACSCLCRDYAPNTIVFLQSNGLAVVADALNLTRRLSESMVANESTSESGPASVTIIASREALEKGSDDTSSAALLAAARKVTARALFFVAYLASTGVSSEGIIHIACLHTESESSDEMVQKAAARALAELLAKSPKAMKDAVHKYMPRRLKEWRTGLQCTEDGDPEEDERRHFIDTLDRFS
ncbi:hypothetical protein JKF63_03946 [Porcisia hertigi]|uniref:Uncharacterized protein n=1 Tax=Porcisia hertigi TaxID=2761500 RepID=A0A836IL22_9TRYP|nr:hypothetical protein JKF63_03946 [Porcisia hertigi]